jgi:hypothetical protein
LSKIDENSRSIENISTSAAQIENHPELIKPGTGVKTQNDR